MNHLLMRALVLCAAITVLLIAQQQSPANETLTNERIIQLIRSGVSTDELTRIVETAKQIAFDLTPAATTNLSQAGVPDDVIKAMAARTNSETPTAQPANAQKLGKQQSPSKSADDHISRAEKANDSVTVTSLPNHATVEFNRKVVGTTPLTYKVGEYAFNAKKSSLFSKRLEQPIVLRVSKEGYVPREVTITKQLVWRSFNGKNQYAYFVITTNNFQIDLDKVSAAPAALTNADVIKLKAAGLGDDLIIDKINNTPAAFKLELDDIVELHKAGISDAVIQAMMHAK